MFPNSNMQVSGTRFSIEVNTQDDNMRIAYKLIQLFFWRMPADIFLSTLKLLDNHRAVLDNIFKCIYRKFETLNVLDPLCADILEFILVILNDESYTGIIFAIPWAPVYALLTAGLPDRTDPKSLKSSKPSADTLKTFHSWDRSSATRSCRTR